MGNKLIIIGMKRFGRDLRGVGGGEGVYKSSNSIRIRWLFVLGEQDSAKLSPPYLS